MLRVFVLSPFTRIGVRFALKRPSDSRTCHLGWEKIKARSVAKNLLARRSHVVP